MKTKSVILITSLFIMTYTCFSFIPKKRTMNSENQDLTYLIRKQRDSLIKAPLLILLHGHGSNEKDLFSFNSQIPDDWIVVSVRAPFKLNEESYSWYDVKLSNQKIKINIEEEEKSRLKILNLIDSITKKHNVNNKAIIVAGFSQGANMASAIGLTSPDKIAGFGVFSGRFLTELKPYISTSKSLKSIKCFLAHGNLDHMLPITYAHENEQELKSRGISVTFSVDNISHKISPKQFDDFLKWLKQFNKQIQ